MESTGYAIDSTIQTDHTGFCRFQCVQSENELLCPHKENEILVVDLKSNDVKQTLQPENGINNKDDLITSRVGLLMCMRHLRFSDQSYILAGYESGAFLTWDMRTNRIINAAKFGECPFSFDFCSLTNRGIYGNASDKLGIFGYNRNEMKLIDRGDIAIKNAGINCIKIRRDQKIFSAGGRDGRIRIFSWKSLRPLAVLTDHKAAISDIEYSNEKVDLWKSPITATSSADGQIALWNIYN